MPKKYLTAAVVIAVASLAGAFACDDDTAAAQTDYGPVLHSLTETVILPEHVAFAARADELAAAMQTLESTPDADSLAKAQGAWRSARAAFRLLDALHFGPVASLGISERIDLSPATPSDIDAIVAGAAPIDAKVVSVAGGHAKGFLGVEYLIFSTDGASAALSRLTGDGAPARRRTLVRAMAEEIASSAHQLADAWDPAKGGYAKDVEGAGATSQRYASQRAAVDDIVGGVGFALELVVGVRLATPLGRKSGGTPEPNLDPTPASDSAVGDMTSSLDGVRVLYQGNGFSSMVRTKSSALDDRATGELGDCGAKLSAIPAPFTSAVSGSTAVVQAAYDACKALKLTWNTDVTSALGATLKPSDNDGD